MMRLKDGGTKRGRCMKKWFLLSAILIMAVFCCVGCSDFLAKVEVCDYPFLHEETEIQRIEIGTTYQIEKENGVDLAVKVEKTIESTEQSAFLEEIKALICRKRLIGDPGTLYADARVIRVVYKNGDYEDLGIHAQATFSDGKYRRTSYYFFDAKAFNLLWKNTYDAQ